MDAKMNDESRDRRREEALARRLGEALDRVAPSGSEPCPDAELIAAYHERALGPEETAQCDSHFAACSRCRKILTVLAASDDAPLAEKEVARLGELVAAASVPRDMAPQIIKPARPSRWDWRTRWLAPALGVAAVLTMWFAIRPPWGTLDQGSSGTLIAQAPKNEPPPNMEPRALDQLSNPAPSKESEAYSAALSTPKDKATSETASSKSPAEALAKNRLNEGVSGGGLTSGAVVADGASEDEKKQKTDVASGTMGGLAPQRPVPAAPPPPPPNLQAEVQAMSQSAQPGPRAATNAPMNGLVVPSARATAQGKTTGAIDSIATFSAASGAINARVLKSPSGTVSWRIGANGRIERSTDAGRNWILQGSPSQQDWLAGAAVSDTICWIVGRGGAIARTTDGEHWEQIIPPSMAANSGKLPDWTAITASDAQTATVTASDQRRYATQDSGKTWRAQ